MVTWPAVKNGTGARGDKSLLAVLLACPDAGHGLWLWVAQIGSTMIQILAS